MKSANASAPETAPEITTAIAEYSPTAAALADIARRMAKVVYDVSTPEGLAAAKRDRAEVRDLRVALEHKRVEIKAPALKRCTEIDTEANRIKAELLKYETPPDEAIKALERKIEDARQAKIKAEQERQAAIERRINAIRDTPRRGALAKTVADLVKLMDEVDAIVIDESFAEMQAVAADAKADTYEQLQRMHGMAVYREVEATRLAAERAELDKQRAEQEAAQKVERDRLAAEEAAATRARQAEADLANMRMSEIHAMGHQVIIATAGRLGVRAGGTRECIVETLAETEKWTVDEEKFGPLLPMAQAAKNSACAMIRGLLDSFDSRVETRRVEGEQAAAQRRIDDQRRELEERQQRERDAAAAKARAEIAAEAARELEAEDQRRKSFVPTLEAVLDVLASTYGVTPERVMEWLPGLVKVAKKKAA